MDPFFKMARLLIQLVWPFNVLIKACWRFISIYHLNYSKFLYFCLFNTFFPNLNDALWSKKCFTVLFKFHFFSSSWRLQWRFSTKTTFLTIFFVIHTFKNLIIIITRKGPFYNKKMKIILIYFWDNMIKIIFWAGIKCARKQS